MSDKDLNHMTSDSVMLNQHLSQGPIHREDQRYDQLEEQRELQSHTPLQQELQPQQIEDKTKVIHGINTPKLSYKELAERINNKTYDRSVFVMWKKSNSESMQEITSALNILNGMLESSVVMFDYKDINREFHVLTKKCLDYMRTHNPRTDEGKARLDLVQKIYNRALEDRHNLDVNAGHLKKSEKSGLLSWKYMIEDHTLVSIPKNQIEKPKGQELSGSSTVTRLIGETSYYMKDQETMPATDHVPTLKIQLKEEYEKTLREIDNPANTRYKDMPEELKAKKKEDIAGILALMDRMDLWIDTYDQDTIKNVDEKKWKKMEWDADCIETYRFGGEYSDEMAELLRNKDRLEKVIKEQAENKEAQKQLEEVQAKIEELMPKYEVELAKSKSYFLAFTRDLSKRAVLYQAGHKDAKIPPGSVLDVRNEATSVLADVFGISDMIMESRSVDVEVQGEKYRALRMQEVFGINGYSDMCDAKYLGKTIQMTPKALKQLQTMQVFDIICGQVDRNYNNYLLQTKEEGDKIIIQSITGIDNDLAFGLLTYNDITFKKDQFGNHHTPGWMKPIEDEKGRTFLAGVDKQFADRVLELKPDMLKYILGPYISKEEIVACQERLKGVQQHLKTLISRDKKKKPEERFMLGTDAAWGERLKTLTSTEGMDDEAKKYQERYVKRLVDHSLIMDHLLNKTMTEFPSFMAWHQYKEKLKKEQQEKQKKEQGGQPQTETEKPQTETTKSDG